MPFSVSSAAFLTGWADLLAYAGGHGAELLSSQLISVMYSFLLCPCI